MIQRFLKKNQKILPNILLQIWHASLKGTFNGCAPVAYLVTSTIYHRLNFSLGP